MPCDPNLSATGAYMFGQLLCCEGGRTNAVLGALSVVGRSGASVWDTYWAGLVLLGATGSLAEYRWSFEQRDLLVSVSYRDVSGLTIGQWPPFGSPEEEALLLALLSMATGGGGTKGRGGQAPPSAMAQADAARVARLGIEAVDDIPGAWRNQERFLEALAEANRRYPHLAGEIQAHHVIPKSLTGKAYTGPTVRIPRSYHQLITNETEALRKAYGSSYSFDDIELRKILDRVYFKYPLPEY